MTLYPLILVALWFPQKSIGLTSENNLPKSQVQHFLKSRTQSSKNKFLLRDYINSQKTCLSQSKQLCQNRLRSLTKEQWSHDWPASSREILSHALFHLAFLAESPTDQKDLIEDALCFDPSYKIPEDIFPKNFQSLVSKQRQSLSRKTIDLKGRIPPNAQILVNGRAESHSAFWKSLKLCTTKTRVTVLSEIKPPQTLIVEKAIWPEEKTAKTKTSNTLSLIQSREKIEEQLSNSVFPPTDPSLRKQNAIWTVMGAFGLGMILKHQLR